MTLKQRIHRFSQIQVFLEDFLNSDYQNHRNNIFPEEYYLELKKITETAVQHNGWFIKENVIHALTQWKDLLSEEKLTQWVLPYQLNEKTSSKKVGIIMAGNIPMVGFHDLLSVLITGHHALIKLSSNDDQIIPFFIKLLVYQNTDFENLITIVKGQLTGFDAIIATGSNNTSRYFEYYFGKHPHIIRKNRTSVAVLTGNESEENLEKLGEDILRYFGMGCRNVSKVFIPHDFDLNRVFKGLFPFQDVIHVHKYRNNYDYHKAIFLMNQDSILENGFLLLKEDTGYHSPISTLFYERYNDLASIQKRLKNDSKNLQCIVGENLSLDEIPFGTTQVPSLTQYADGVDTLQFLKKLY